MSEIRTTYRSFLLRLWREDQSGAAWRAMLESTTNPGQRRYFKDLESLTAYLLAWVGDDPPDIDGGEWLSD
jgi:hypothetical protein